MKNFKKLFATVLSLCMFLSSIYSVQTFGDYFKTFSFREIDQLINEYTPSESWREEFDKCEANRENLVKTYYDKEETLIIGAFSTVLALPLIGLALGHFVPKFLNRKSSNEKTSTSKNESKSQQRTNSESSKNKKRSWKTIGTLIGGLASGICCYFFKSKIAKLEADKRKDLKALPDCLQMKKNSEELNKDKASVLARLFFNIKSARRVGLDPSKKFFNQGKCNAFIVQYSDSGDFTGFNLVDVKDFVLVDVKDDENYNYTDDEKNGFSEKTEGWLKKIKTILNLNNQYCENIDCRSAQLN